MPLAPIDKADLLSRLAEGHAAGVTVVTPNRRPASERAGELPMLLTPAQERHLWEETIAASEAGGALASPGEAAARAMQAWRLAHAWRIAGALGEIAGGGEARAPFRPGAG